MRLHRLIGIILLLESRGIVKAKDLAHALETSERTIYRDIDILCESGLAIKSESGPTGGFSFMDGYKVNMNRLHCDDVINIFLSGIGIRPEAYSENALALKNAIVKLEANVPKEFVPDIVKAKKRFYFDASPWWREVSEDKNLDNVRRAVWKSYKLQIKYIKVNGEISERVIKPYGLIVKDNEWYLAAYCEKREEVRSFKCNRIHEVIECNDNFQIPDEFNLEEFWVENVKKFKVQALKPKYKSYPVKIKLKHEKKELLNGFEVIDKFKENDSYIYKINMINYITACTALFPLCDRVEIVEPLKIKEAIVNKALEILKTNKDKSFQTLNY